MVTIAVIGGSVVYGIGCKDGMDRTRMRCAWPGRLGRALCAMFPAAGVRIVDLSVPATNLHSFLTRSPEIFKREKAPADLYIIDYNLNDRRVIKDTLVDVVTLIDILRRRAGGNAAKNTIAGLNKSEGQIATFDGGAKQSNDSDISGNNYAGKLSKAHRNAKGGTNKGLTSGALLGKVGGSSW